MGAPIIICNNIYPRPRSWRYVARCGLTRSASVAEETLARHLRTLARFLCVNSAKNLDLDPFASAVQPPQGGLDDSHAAATSAAVTSTSAKHQKRGAAPKL